MATFFLFSASTVKDWSPSTHGSIVLLRGWRIAQWPLPSWFMGRSEFIAGEH